MILHKGSKTYVGIDVDGVLRDWHGMVNQLYREDFPDHEVKEVTAWDMRPFYPLGDKIYEWAIDWRGRETFGQALPYEGAQEMLVALRHMGCHITIVTWQKPRLRDVTLRWLVKHRMPHDDIFFTMDKALYAGDILLDDGAHNLQAVAEHVYPVCMDRPWNRKDWEGPRVYSHKEFTELIKAVTQEEG